MPFQPGNNLGGRKPGSRGIAARRLEEMGCDPLEGMAKLAMDPANPPELRGRMYAELTSYLYPKLKAVEHTGADGAPLNAGNMDAVELLTRRMDSLADKLKPSGDSPRLNTTTG